MDRLYDLVIIGGGINGAGIARDAAGRGLSVYLCEKGDLAQGTSSASTKLIHGGLRYLEFYEFRLVRDALQEREVLLRAAPHIIWPLEFVLPHNDRLRPAWLLRLGLFLYDHLTWAGGGDRMLPSSYKINLRASRFGRPLKKYVKTGFVYSDCWVEDSRLVVLTARDAANRGAEIQTYTSFLGAVRDGDHWAVTVQPHGEAARTIRARTLVNATGPGLQKVASLIEGKAGQVQPLRLVKGSHIVVAKLYDGEHAYILQNTDRRMIFIIPFETDYSLIGTTDLHQEPGLATEPKITDGEIDYLLQAVNGYFAAAVQRGDIKYTYSGIRPLFDDGDANNSRVTRDYKLVMGGGDDMPGVLNVYGGKITTFRRLAEDAVDKILRKHRGEMREAWTEGATLPGGDIPQATTVGRARVTPMGNMKAFVAALQTRYPFLSQAHSERLAYTYGTGAWVILETCSSLADLGQNFGGDERGPLTAREVDYLVTYEWARKADDILFRRTRLGMIEGLVDKGALETYLAEKQQV